MKDKKQLIENFFSLSLLQSFNMLLPLITTPYLVRILGVENFGLINFALAIIMYFHIITNFGFNISIPRKIAQCRNNNEKISEIFSTVMVIKILLMLVSFIALLILIFSFDIFKKNTNLYLASFGIVIGNVLFPIWFFQGIEKMKYISFINILSKTCFTLLIFILVNDSDDFIYVPILTSLGYIVGGLYSLLVISKNFSINFKFPNRRKILNELRDSFEVFISRISNQGSRYFATSIIGLSFGNYILGYYSMIEKLYFAFMSIPGVISQTIYPYMCRTKNIHFFKKMLLLVIIVLFIILLPIIYYRDFIISLIFNINDSMLSTFFLIIFISPFFGIVNTLIGYPLLGSLGYMNYANKSLIYASIVQVIFILFVSLILKNIYLSIFSIVLYQLIGLILRLIYLKKIKIKNV